MKLGIYSACLPELSPDEAIEAATSSGYAGIEWRVSSQVGGAGAPDFLANNRCTVRPEEADIARVCAATRAAGLEVISLAPYIDSGDLDEVDRLMVIAQRHGVPAVRLRAPWMGPQGFHKLFDEASNFFSHVAVLGQHYDVQAQLEIHQRSICPSASLAQQLVGHLSHTSVGVIYDVGNLVVEGYEDHAMALQILGQHLSHVHLKNAAYFPDPEGGPWKHRWTPIDEGIVDVDRVLSLLEASGYSGWISVEDFSTSRSDMDKLAFNAAYLRGKPAFSSSTPQPA
ncbi:sugar phosphate isomerase/epimerase family protein [Pseudarthrobacter sp. NPDC080039]|uniref:sugar phosphate isomerase/epimerase family protein n=1 Tax=unclassified Pseudarthrobacter TaxID=2647000 RepID=UPI00344DBFAE